MPEIRHPARGLLRVRPVDTDESMPGGRVVLLAATRAALVAWQCEVEASGEWAACEDEDCERQHMASALGVRLHPCRAVAGDWLLVRPRSYVAGLDGDSPPWFVRQDDVLAILHAEG